MSGCARWSTTRKRVQKKKKHAVTWYGKGSKIKCVSMHKRGRKFKGQTQAENYMKTRKKRAAGVKDIGAEIARVLNRRMVALTGDTDAQCQLLFSLMDVLRKEEQSVEDLITTEMKCEPDKVPIYLQRELIHTDLFKNEYTCEECEKDSLIYEDGRKVCEDCGLQTTDYVGDYYTQNTYACHANGEKRRATAGEGSSSLENKHIYDRMSNFKTQLRQLQGQGESKLDPNILTYLLNASKWIKKDKIDCEWICTQLKKCKGGKHIPDRQRLAKIVSGGQYKPPDLGHEIVQQLLGDFEKLCISYDSWISHEGKHSARKNFMSYSFVVYQLLCRYNLRKHTKDLRMIKNPDRLQEQVALWKVVGRQAGFDFYYLN